MSWADYQRKPGRCQDCAQPTYGRRSIRCRPCANQAKRRTSGPTCEACGGPVARWQSKRCAACYRARGPVTHVCPDCSGPKHARAVRCKGCAYAALATVQRRRLRSLILRYRGRELARQFDRADLDWSIAEVAARAGVHAATIRSWIDGEHAPHEFELAAVMRVLAFERCEHCRGLGWTDPTERRPRRERSA